MPPAGSGWSGQRGCRTPGCQSGKTWGCLPPDESGSDSAALALNAWCTDGERQQKSFLVYFIGHYDNNVQTFLPKNTPFLVNLEHNTLWVSEHCFHTLCKSHTQIDYVWDHSCGAFTLADRWWKITLQTVTTTPFVQWWSDFHWSVSVSPLFARVNPTEHTVWVQCTDKLTELKSCPLTHTIYNRQPFQLMQSCDCDMIFCC